MFRQLMKRAAPADNLAIGFFTIAAVYALLRGTARTILAGIAFVLIMLGALPRQATLAFLVGASVILLLQTRGGAEGFASSGKKKLTLQHLLGVEGFADAEETEKKEEVAEKKEEEKVEEKEKEKAEEVEEAPAAAAAAAAAKKDAAEKAKSEKFAGGATKKPLLPDNATRKEPLELGKPYKLPNENDDKGYHIDAGTTFLNAYKALKPDQIAAMTKDTQELLATQKSLVGMLESFGPLMKDMNKITGFFNSK